MRTTDNVVTTYYKVITTHSLRSKSRMCRYFYSLSISLLIYCMYITVNKATFIVEETIKATIKKCIKTINTTSLSDSKLSSKVATHIYYRISYE